MTSRLKLHLVACSALVALVPLALVPPPAVAQTAGVVAAVNQTVRGTQPGRSIRTFTLGANVVRNERIDVDSRGLVQILLADGTTFTVGPNSSLVIDSFVYNPDANTAQVTATAKRTTTSKAHAEDRAFKVVCWMKPEEAQVVAEAYATETSVRTTTGAGSEVEAVWYGPDHPDAITYRAGVCMLRHRRSGDPRRMWIRREEALAVIEAYESAETVEYVHVQHGTGGRAVHHPDDAPEVRKYLANVMLTRFR